jgi:uncharacterized protein YlxW (UPF0749 family)
MPGLKDAGGSRDAGESGAGSTTISAALLENLLNNPLDPGYQAAADGPKRRHWWDAPLVWLGCTAVGLLLVVAYDQHHRSAPARDLARRDLISRIHDLQDSRDRLDGTAKGLANDVAKLRDSQLAGGGTGLRDLEVASGAVAVSGPGIVIQLAEPPAKDPSAGNARPGTTPQQAIAVLRDRDVRSVVNQLLSSGAEAVAVNGIRLTSMSAIRFAGESILVDFQPINSPYSIEAIGPRDRLILEFADSAVARQLKTKESVYGITFKFNGKSDLHLSSATVARPQYASRGLPTPTPSNTESPR